MDVKQFFAADFGATLFPLKTNLVVIENHSPAIAAYIGKILSDDPVHIGDSFLPQTKVHAAKPRNHLRRTAVLDPVASYFIYDLVLRNQKSFGVAVSNSRRSFGYRFDGGKPVPVHKAYNDFGAEVGKLSEAHKHVLKFDIASFFNSVYHHDATNWFAALPNISGPDSNAFGRFFREINAGRSIDFLPQGIYPTKMIGSEFLRFLETSGEIKCAQSLRFMDDMYLFDDQEQKLAQDFFRIQELLGLRGLNVNPTKTVYDGEDASVKDKASAIQEELAELVDGIAGATVYSASGVEIQMDASEVAEAVLSDEKIEALLKLLVHPLADEGDVEMILGILHENAVDLANLLPSLLGRFPNIMKQLHKLVGVTDQKDKLTSELIALVSSEAQLIEYQLFWIAAMAEDHLFGTADFGKLILALYDRTSSHKIARAKILEIPDQSFGLKEIRDEVLKSGTSDWLSWSSAVGTRSLKKAERNYSLKYFAKGSPLNHLIADCVQGLPEPAN